MAIILGQKGSKTWMSEEETPSAGHGYTKKMPAVLYFIWGKVRPAMYAMHSLNQGVLGLVTL